MNTTHYFLALLCFFCSFNIGFSQSTPDFVCGFDDLRTPAREKRIQQLEEQLQLHLLKNQGAAQKALLGLPYVVPVVVHIIHDGGSENIPDAQIVAAIGHLNEGFAAQGYFAQQGATVNTQIQFCLAKRDPDGNATSGITRTQSPLTNMVMETQDIPTKDLSRWNPLDYVNIWVVKEITSQSLGAGVAGYAVFPSSHGDPEDGMICEAKYFGASPSEDAVLVHEMGHYFGLYHTFQGGCQNNNCQLDGDKVCDTPPDNATHTTCPFNSCATDVAPGSPFAMDVEDYTGDFMDYSPFSCYHFFTADQALRMQGSVETARLSLLESKGCLDPCTQPVTAAFTATPNPVLAGQTVTFTNNSTGASTYSWTENGTEFSQSQQTTRIFNTVGQFSILLTAGNSDPNCVSTAAVDIKVECPMEALFTSTNTTAEIGETVLFTNQSTGTGPLNYAWRVNNQLVSTAQDLSYLFQTAGIFSITLDVTGPFCSKTYSIVFTVNNPCGQTASVSIGYTSPNKIFFTQDLATLPDGSLIHCGSHNNRPAVTRWDAAGNVMWHKVTTDNGGFFDMEPSPDGQFLLNGQIGNQFLVAKIDIDGNFTMYKKLNLTDNFPNGDFTDVCAANPDGSFGLFVLDDFDAYLIKVAANGTILWSRNIPILGIGGLRVATDGTGDFLICTFASLGAPPAAITVMRFNQNGQAMGATKYGFPAENFQGLSYEDLSVHQEDGGYSIFFTGFLPAGASVGQKRLVRCAADGSVLWAKRYVTSNGLFSQYAGFRHLPDQRGWLVTDFKSTINFGTKGNYLLHISNDGEPLWQRKYSDGGPFDEAMIAAEWQDGLVKGVWDAADNSEWRLLRLPDSNAPLDCIPDVPLTETTFPMTVTTENVVVPNVPANLSLIDIPFTLANDILTAIPYCSAPLPCAEICDNHLDDDADGYIDCFDTDCDCNVADDCTVPPPATAITAQLDWESASSPVFVYSTPKVANMNPQTDNMPEIIVATSSTTNMNNIDRLYFFQGDGSNQAIPRRLDIPQLLSDGNAIAVGDLDGDKIPELVAVCFDGLVRIYKNYNPIAANAMQLWATSNIGPGTVNASPSLADFDADGVPEIYAGNAVFKLDLSNPAAPQLIRAVNSPFGPSGRNSYISIVHVSTAADLLTPSECNGDPDCAGLELAAGFEIYSIDLDLNDGDGYQIKTQRSLQNLDPNHFWQDGLTAVADVDLDGTPDVVVTGARDFSEYGVYVWNKNGLVRFLPYFYPGATDYEPSGSMPCIANLFDDTKLGAAVDFPEILATSATQLYAFNLNAANISPGNPTWWSVATTDLSGYAGATTFDLNGDGANEIIYRDQTNLRVMYGGNPPFPAGVTPQRNWLTFPVTSGTREEYPIVADVDDDGAAEIVVTGASGPAAWFGKLKVFEHTNLPWRPCRNIWNQDNYHVSNINDDLSIPVVMQQHWLEFPAPGSGKWPINTYLSQRSSLSELTVPGIAVPDASLAVDSVHCIADSMEVFLTVCNVGKTDLTAPLPLAFYGSNPTTTAATMLFPPIALNDVIQKDSCRQFQLLIPAVYNQNTYLVFNDNGSLPTPFSLATTTLSTTQAECRFDNNLDLFQFQNQTPALDLGPDITLCSNSVVTLSANPNFQRYRWQDGSDAPTFTAYTSGTFWVDAFDACGFKQSDTVHILLNTLAVLNLPDQWTVCPGETVNLAASGFAQYTWAPADSVNCANCPAVEVVPKSDFTIYLTAATGACFVSDSVQVKVHPVPAIQLQALDGDCDTPASITTNVTGVAPFTYQWSNSNTDPVLNTSQAGIYTVNITDTNGCTASDSAAVSIVSSLVVSANVVAPTCAGFQTGSIDLTVGGGSQPMQFLWSNNALTEDLTNVSAGTYTVISTDANGCSATMAFDVIEPPVIQLSHQTTDPVCAGETTGAIDVSAAGGAGNLLFSWSNNTALEDADNLPAGIYSVVVTDANGCTAVLSDTLIDPPGLLLGLQTTDPACAGDATGALDLTASGGIGTLLFSWSNNTALEDAGNLPAGTYSVVVTDAHGCSAVLSETLIDPPGMILNAQTSNPACAGGATGSIDLTIGGGSGNIGFSWSNNVVLEDLNNVPAGTYTVVSTDGNGCTATLTETLIDPPIMIVTLAKTDPLCAGEASGALDLTASGGTGSFTFFWSNNTSLEDPNNLTAGTYSVITTDDNGCTAVLSETLIDPPGMLLSSQHTDPACAGDATGAIDLTVTGGNGNLTFSWSNNSSLEDPSNLPAGTYSVITTDANGCTAVLSETLIDPPGMVLSLQHTDPACAGDATGSIDLTASGGNGNITFSWSNNNSLEDQPNLTAGTYSVVTSDANGCTATVAATLIDPPTLVLSLQKTDPACAGEPTGALNLNASGGTGNLAFSWSNNSQLEDLTQIPAGMYSVITTDANGCTATLTETLTDPPAIVWNLPNTVLNCPGDIGVINLSITGGVAPFTFSWSNGDVSEDITIAQSGTYSVVANDANGCTISGNSVVTTLSMAPVLQLSAGSLTCTQTSAVISAVSDISNTGFLWSGDNGFTSNLPAPVVTSSGLFTVIATDPIGGCTTVGNVSVPIDTMPPTLVLADDYIEIPCGQDDIGLSAAGSSSGPNVSILWTASNGGLILNGAQTLSPTVAGSGFYDLVITNLSNGCVANDVVEVVASETITGIVTADSVRCYGETSGALYIISTVGGVAPYQYSLDNQNFKPEPVFENLSAGTYQVYIQDVNDCFFTTEMTVGQPAPFSVALSGDSLVVPGVAAHVQAIITPPGFVPAQISWSASGVNIADQQLEQNLELLQTTLFQVTILDANGCFASDTFQVRVDREHHVYIPNAIYPESSSGENQTFVLYAGESVAEIEYLRIFDRWGDQVFANESFPPNDVSQGWSGLFKGKPVQAGAYVWVARVVYKDGSKEVMKGDLTVVR